MTESTARAGSGVSGGGSDAAQAGEPPAVRTEERAGILIVTIDRPRARNAVNTAVAQGLADAFDLLDSRDDLRVAILTGAGGVFSAGMDLKAFLTGENPNVGDRGFAGFTARPPRKPLIAAVEGWVLAGGCEMVLGCDLVVAADNSKFGLPEVKRGLVAAAGGVFRLPKRIPYHVAMELVLTGEPIDASQARAWGLVNRLTPPGGALEGALELAAQVAANGPLALAASKEMIRRSAGWTDEESWAAQAELVYPVMASEDAREGAQAFAEKRAPVWRGR